MSNVKLQYPASNLLIINKGEIYSLFYHKLFNYPLTSKEVKKWKLSCVKLKPLPKMIKIGNDKGYLYIGDSKKDVYKRIMRESISIEKLKIAKKAALLFSKIPTVKMVAITGSLAMNNADDLSDIDLMIITKNKTLWTSRLLALFLLVITGFSVRRFGKSKQKDMICPNIFLDENDLAWKKKNIFTAHEIAQIIPILNKDNTYEKFIKRNKWIIRYWPNSVKIQNIKNKDGGVNLPSTLFFTLCFIFEPIAFLLQRIYMGGKMTNEVATSTQALFHPNDLSKMIIKSFEASISD